MSDKTSFIEKLCDWILFPFRLLVFIVALPFQLCIWLVQLCRGGQKSEDACPAFRDIPVKNETDRIDAAWPPAPHPVEALSVMALIKANSECIRNICHASGLTEEENQKYLLPVITNLARIVHLVPASEYDHHQGYGGLFTHTLDVAYRSANQAKNTIFDRSAEPIVAYQNKRRWILTAILAALTHDIGKPFTDMEITAPNGRHWPKNEPILDWLRRYGIKSYYISFKPGREHNEHKSAALEKSAMLIPKQTLEFLALTGSGEILQNEFRRAVLEGRKGGLVGEILDSADGFSRRSDMLRQRVIRPEFKNVAHPQGDQVLKAIRALIKSAAWTTNQDKDSRVFHTKQGCFLVWTEISAEEVRSEAVRMGYEGLPSDYVKLGSILVDAGAALMTTDEVSNTRNIFWRVRPIVLGDVAIDCICMSSPQYVFDAVSPPEIEAIVEGRAIDDVTRKAWTERWQVLPKEIISREEEQAMGYTPEYVDLVSRDLEEREATSAEAADLYNEALSGSDALQGSVPSDNEDSEAAAGDRTSSPEMSEGHSAAPEHNSPRNSEGSAERPQPAELPHASEADEFSSVFPDDLVENTDPDREQEQEQEKEQEQDMDSGMTGIGSASRGAAPFSDDDATSEPEDDSIPGAARNGSDNAGAENVESPERQAVNNREDGFGRSGMRASEYYCTSNSEEESDDVRKGSQKSAADESDFDMDALFGRDSETTDSEGEKSANLRKCREDENRVRPDGKSAEKAEKEGTGLQGQSVRNPDVTQVSNPAGITAAAASSPAPSASAASVKYPKGSEANKAAKGSRKRSIDDKDAMLQEMLREMVLELKAHGGAWVDRVSTDLTTGRFYTSSLPFEATAAQADINPDLIELSIELIASEGVVPRLEWDRRGHRMILID